MSKSNKFRKRMHYLLQMLSILAKTDGKFLITSIMEIVIVSVLPFVNMYLLSYTINAFTAGADFAPYAWRVALFLIMWLLLSIAQVYINNYNTVKGNLIGQKLYTNILKNSLDMDYEKLLDPKILEKKELATKALENGSFTALIVNFKNIMASLIVVGGVFAIISQVDGWILLMSLGVIVMQGWLSYTGKKHQYNADEELVPINRKISYYIDLSTNHSTAKEVRLFHMKDQLLSRYNALYNETLAVLKKVFKMNRHISSAGIVMNFLLEAAIYLYLGYKLLVGGLITIGDFTLYGNAIRQFKDSMSNLLASFADIDNNGRYIQDYFEFMEIPSEFKKSRGCLPPLENITIRFDHVSYKYPNQEDYALQDINLTITDKTCLSLVGENGSGKTTFVKLLIRLCDPTEGNIYLNDVNIKDIAYAEYQKIFSVIFQDFNLYAFSIRENITMLTPAPRGEDDRIMDVVDKVGLKTRIEKEERGLDTYLYYVYDENGMELSGGEGQKLATARVLYKNSAIVILDEPTAALDPRAEFEILSNFHKIIHNRMAIYISHRLSSCRFSDHVAVFKNGRIVEYGNHDSLMKQKGLYAELYDMQARFYTEKSEATV